MRASHDLSRVSISFDEPNLVSHAGLVAPAALAQRLGVAALVDARVDLAGARGGANVGTKAMTIIGGLLAGADSIDDMDVMRAGATGDLFEVRAPSTLGTCLRPFSFGDVRALDAVTRQLLVRAWAGGGGPAPGADATADMDSTICQAMPADQTGKKGRVTLRADSGFYSRAVIRAVRKADARFSITVRSNPSIKAAIAAIPDDAWIPIPYWSSAGTFGHHDDGTAVSGADVAETTYTAFAGTPDATDVRL